MTVIRRIYFEAANNNFTLRITHISGVDNTLADAVSRFDNARFFENHPKANTEPIMVDNILDFLREIMLGPGNCSNSMQDRESSSEGPDVKGVLRVSILAFYGTKVEGIQREQDLSSVIDAPFSSALKGRRSQVHPTKEFKARPGCFE
ncbi:hypothetical protein RvY_01869 [Ramazzottius varieornatus]|uniref:Uncharacterized protein n=1 Tax=Ramazzottius varieornatus TaxID=947166 RepID=A0A1D1USG2_RAMVA|nr:hypothetical protein RvY_01869 [Ramazzottius varieornatus]